MTLLARKHAILHLLVANLNNEQPQTMDTKSISQQLGMSHRETCQFIKMMNEMGIVESDQDGERVLVTRQGLAYAAEMHLSRAA